MRTHTQDRLPVEEYVLWIRTERLVTMLSPPNLGLDDQGQRVVLSCHMIARALGRMLSLQVVDGHATAGYEHSWLLTKHGNILDVYPVATIGGPLLIDGDTLYARQIYKKRSTRNISRGRFGKACFKQSVRKIERALRKIDDSPLRG